MNCNPEPDLEQDPPHIAIVSDGDLTFSVVRRRWLDEDVVEATGPIINIFGYIQVSRKVLIESSEYFRALLAGGFSEASQDVIEVQDVPLRSLELWLRCFHDAVNEDCYELSLKEIENAIQFGLEKMFCIEDLNHWTTTYLTRLCRTLERPSIVAYLSKHLVFYSTSSKVMEFLTCSSVLPGGEDISSQ